MLTCHARGYTQKKNYCEIFVISMSSSSSFLITTPDYTYQFFIPYIFLTHYPSLHIQSPSLMYYPPPLVLLPSLLQPYHINLWYWHHSFHQSPSPANGETKTKWSLWDIFWLVRREGQKDAKRELFWDHYVKRQSSKKRNWLSKKKEHTGAMEIASQRRVR